MRRSYINPVSAKQKLKNKHWAKVTNEKCEELEYICQWCGKKGQREDRERWDYLDGHHVIKRRFNIHTKENCFVCHRLCHFEIEVNTIDVREYKTRKEWKDESTRAC